MSNFGWVMSKDKWLPQSEMCLSTEFSIT